MRHIEVEDGLRLRFPGRNASFAEGVEIGILVARMAACRSEFTVRLGVETLDQARAVAAGMGYRVHVVETAEDTVVVAVMVRGRRPRLTLVRDAVAAAGAR